MKKRKLEEAERLLKYTDLPIVKVIKVVNYTNISYFYKQFEKVFNTTPNEYRKQYRDEQKNNLQRVGDIDE